jgi:hypothetical protein
MAKKTPKKKSDGGGFSYPRVYTLVLYNTNNSDHGSTFGVLSQLVQEEIDRIDRCEIDADHLKQLLVIREQLIVEFDKGRYGPRGSKGGE